MFKALAPPVLMTGILILPLAFLLDLAGLLLAIRANPKKIKAVTGDLKACFFNKLLGQTLDAPQLRINDFLALGTDKMWVGVRVFTVIAVASLGKSQLQDLVELLKKGHCFVHRCQACGRKILFHLFVYVFSARMAIARRQNFKHGNTLWRNAETPLPEPFHHIFQSNLLIGHSLSVEIHN